MLQAPRVFALGLASDSARASKTEVGECCQGIEEHLNLRDVFDLSEDLQYSLVSISSFYESHWLCFCKRGGAGWLLYDDDRAIVVGPTFADVAAKCVAGRLMPALLMWERV